MFDTHGSRPHSARRPDLPPVIDEAAWLERRKLVKALGLGGLAAAAGWRPALGQEGGGPGGAGQDDAADEAARYAPSERWKPGWKPAGGAELYPAVRNAAYRAGRPLTPEDTAATYNNFYEFTIVKGRVKDLVGGFDFRPWTVEIAGEVEEPRTVDVDEIAKIAPLEERVYRFRCVEAWSMVVPWTGLPLARFIEWCKPKPAARFVRFFSFDRPAQAPGQKSQPWYPWPYYEGLRMDEARHPLALLATGIFGHGLPGQHGAPLRVIVPWKYGYKSPKSIVRVEFVREQPKTFWEELQPKEYPFLSNVEPDVPHPRWSQATERDIATGDTLPTLPYNGYGEVAGLYR